ncbi:MAG: hypothetical protein WCX73_00830 [Candidatus Pacearchaeota archaeon]|jgi:hypothetical protein
MALKIQNSFKPKIPPKTKFGNIHDFLEMLIIKKKKNFEDSKQRFDKYISQESINNTWFHQRQLSDYLDILPVDSKIITKNSFFNFLKTRSKETREELSILDDGIGDGFFLSELKNELNKLNIRNKTTGITLSKSDTENFKKNIANINEVLYTRTEDYVPKKRFDLITSAYGGFNYSFEIIKKEVLLKLAYSLKKGGVLIILFDLDMSLVNLKPKKENPYINYNFISPKEITRFSTTLIQSLNKRGFDAEIKKVSAKNMLQDVLIIKRVK